MPPRDINRRRLERRREIQMRRRRAGALAVLLAVVVIAVVIVLSSGGGGTPARRTSARARGSSPRPARHQAAHHGSTVKGAGTGTPGSASVPILMYHVINPPPSGAPFPGLYVTADEFAAQMQALKADGWHAVTLDQVMAYWQRGVPLGSGKPIVLTFDNGYQSQYTNALPVLKRLGWVADENMQLTGLPPSQGGLTDSQIRGLISAGWELDTQGISHADLIALSSSALQYQVASSRQTLRRRYNVPVNWFCYPSGHYNATVIAAVKAAGYVGSTTVIPGWAQRSEDPYRLPRLRVLGGTSPSALLQQIATAESNGAPPAAYGGAGTA